MRLETQFTVEAPLDRAWDALSDIGVVASCIPGGRLRQVDDIYTGRIEAAANGASVVCDATVRAVDRDEDEHAATVLVHARQVGGPAIGSATIRSRCQAADGSTQVTLSAEVSSSGHDTGADALERGSRELLDQLARMLFERAVTQPAPVTPPPPRPAAAPAAAESADPATSVSVTVTAQKDLQRRAAVAGGALVAVLLVSRLLGRRRTGRR